jgi:hypothetical protein
MLYRATIAWLKITRAYGMRAQGCGVRRPKNGVVKLQQERPLLQSIVFIIQHRIIIYLPA